MNENLSELHQSSLAALEWPDFLSYYSGFCSSTPAQERAAISELPSTSSESERLLRLTQEGIAVLELQSFATLGNLPELTSSCQRLQKKACLSGIELWGIGVYLQIAEEIRDFFSSKQGRESCPELALELGEIEAHREEKLAITRAIDADGQVKDSASPRLAKLRREERSIHDDARKETERALKHAHQEGFAQDLFFDVRDGRYVIPIKREHRGQIPGIVFESSGSRATVYVEPASLRNTNDRIRQIQVEIEEEVYIILRDLSDRLAPFHESLLRGFSRVLDFDLTLGRARLSRDLENYKHASPWEFQESIELFGFYHPLLRRHLNADTVITSAFAPDKKTRVIVISGPNTGGKTVFLKAIGIAALMARGGFFLPISQPGRIPFFREVLAQIGDEQSLEKSLSSFSSSIMIMREILKLAAQDSLILIDEILSSTDPREAAALAKAILKELAGKRAFCIVTTHFGDLKQLADEDESIMNASMEFNPEALKPMYRLRLGMPGRSWAIETAARLGLPPHLIEAARTSAGDEHLRMDNLLARVETREAELLQEQENLTLERLEATEQTAKAKSMREELFQERARLRDSLQIEFRRREAEAMEKVERVLEEYRQRLAELPEKSSLPDRTAAVQNARRIAADLRKDFDRAIDDVRASANVEPEILTADRGAIDSLRVGTMVRIPAKNITGRLLSDPATSKNIAEVQAGLLKIKVAWDQIYPLDGPTSEPKKQKRARGNTPDRESCAPELNLLGLRADEALVKLEDYLDRASQSSLPSVRIVHGHGTGALKKLVRDHLSSNAYRFKFRPGNRDEGGDGCTVIELSER